MECIRFYVVKAWLLDYDGRSVLVVLKVYMLLMIRLNLWELAGDYGVCVSFVDLWYTLAMRSLVTLLLCDEFVVVLCRCRWFITCVCISCTH